MERFWSKVQKSDGCWLWTAHVSDYGAFWFEGRNHAAHRIAWALTNGPIPPGMVVMHRCDNPPCVRPDHLRLGTDRENTHDMLAKGRAQTGDRHYSHRTPDRVLRGERHGQSRFTEAEVLAIRDAYASGISMYRIAKDRGVSSTAIRYIVRREHWSHI